MAEHAAAGAHDGFLLYLIDLAILEANAKLAAATHKETHTPNFERFRNATLASNLDAPAAGYNLPS